MMIELNWLKLALEKGKVVLIESNFEIPVKKILHTWEKTAQSKEVGMVISVFPKPMDWFACSYKQISKSEEIELISLYFTYEFSNDFCVLSRQFGCGSFLNLVDSGVISLDEALLAWLDG